MAFLKYANAAVVKPITSLPAWDEVRHRAMQGGSAFDQRIAAQVVLKEFDPNKFLLSHCTIIASVDTENGPGKLGRNFEGGFTVNRRYSDYFITPSTAKYVNNNQDSWERKLLLATFKTFVGGENYVEHLQIPELSKGKIIDAAARDIGDSIYVDILVATDRQHGPLIDAISSGQLQTLSMGCQVSHTTCTKCGNTSEDETQLCSHIRYQKGNTFVDALGKQRKIAELCGHYTDPKSVKFIEASWVANPAFTGAVLRNIFSPQEIAQMSPKIQVAFSQPARVADPRLIQKAARRTLWAQDQGQNPTEGEGQAPAAAPPEDPMESAVSELADHIRQKAIEKVRGEMNGPQPTPGPPGSENLNETLIRQALAENPALRKIAGVVFKSVKDPLIARRILTGLVHHRNGGWIQVSKQGFSGKEILAISRILDLNSGLRMAGDNRIYRTVVAVGGAAAYADVESYLTACHRVIRRDMTQAEKEALIVKGRLFDLGN
jgi:hypothetical protein